MLLRHTEIIAVISTHAPAGGATLIIGSVDTEVVTFLLTPLREGRPEQRRGLWLAQAVRLPPLREGRLTEITRAVLAETFLLTPLREVRPL